MAAGKSKRGILLVVGAGAVLWWVMSRSGQGVPVVGAGQPMPVQQGAQSGLLSGLVNALRGGSVPAGVSAPSHVGWSGPSPYAPMTSAEWQASRAYDPGLWAQQVASLDSINQLDTWQGLQQYNSMNDALAGGVTYSGLDFGFQI